MKTHILGFAILTAFGSAAMAADLPMKAPPAMVAPAPMWTGFYVGVNGGYGWGRSTVNETPFSNVFVPAGPFAGQPPVPPASVKNNLNGALIGVHAGYNWQFSPNWLVGIEGDFDGSGMSASKQVVLPDPLGGGGGLATDGFSANSKVEWLASIRARFGYVWGPNLFYVTGGGAWEHVKTNILLSTDTTGGVFSTSTAAAFNDTLSGWVAGAGFEHMIAANWLVRAEYLHYGFNHSTVGTVTVNCAAFGAAAACGGNISSTKNDIDAVRVGLSYKFN